jgi:hypothetical protein
MNPVVVLRTGQLWQMDMAEEALKQAGIAYFRQEETSSGLRLAMPLMPSAGPGMSFALLVPETAVAKALEVLSAMPFEIKTNPGAWDGLPGLGERE